ncbi:hypothetical protein L9F63_014566, partial [Diploptera punctata]
VMDLKQRGKEEELYFSFKVKCHKPEGRGIRLFFKLTQTFWPHHSPVVYLASNIGTLSSNVHKIVSEMRTRRERCLTGETPYCPPPTIRKYNHFENIRPIYERHSHRKLQTEN